MTRTPSGSGRSCNLDRTARAWPPGGGVRWMSMAGVSPAMKRLSGLGLIRYVQREAPS